MAQWPTVTVPSALAGAEMSAPAPVRPIRRALLSVSDTTGLAELAGDLIGQGVTLVASGGTAARLRQAGYPVTEVADLTGLPALLDGRVKTLHPVIHAGLLAEPDRPDHRADLAQLGAEPFDLAVVSLYPFAAAVASGADEQTCIAQIDVGGPALIRAAAKNHAHVAILTSPRQYPEARAALAAGGTTLAQRRRWAADAFAVTAAYDEAVSQWCAAAGPAEPEPGAAEAPRWAPLVRREEHDRVTPLRYGENPHQPAYLYRSREHAPGVATAALLQGRAMSYTNYLDADAAYRAAHDHAGVCVAIIKHANPCGIAGGRDVAEAYHRAVACDPQAAFGGVIAVTRPLDAPAAAAIAELFTEVVLAPAFTEEALAILGTRPALRLLCVAAPHPGRRIEQRPISGGLLVQVADAMDSDGDDPRRWHVAAGAAPDDSLWADLEFAWRCVRAPRSNAIVLARQGATVGISAGHVSRVAAAHSAVAKAGERARGAVAASDGFFPFRDGLDALAAAGVQAVLAPAGSVRDDEVAAAAAAAGVTLIHASARHFSH